MCVDVTVNVWAAELIVQLRVSPFANLVVTLSVPDLVYFTNTVSGSVPSVTVEFITVATTPDVAPVIVAPT